MNKALLCLLSSLFLGTLVTNAKVLIITPVYNRPDFIQIQVRTFKKFFQDEYTFLVFNDASNPQMQRKIEQTCQTLGIECIRVPQTLHDVDPLCHQAPTSFRHGESLHFALTNYGFKHDDFVMIIDSDVFLIHNFSVKRFMQDHDLYVVFGGSLLPQLCFLNMPNLPRPQDIDFRAGYVNNNAIFWDVGCRTRGYIEAHPQLRLKHAEPHWGGLDLLNLDLTQNLASQLQAKQFLPAEISLINDIIKLGAKDGYHYDADIGFFEGNTFLDYKHGSGWHGAKDEVTKKKNRLINAFIKALLRTP
ncbi:MAG TPA: glycosyltransferase family A protein [Candidatus Babeliales bacterium]|nr:MAG: hypothetical protein A3F67_01050 [Verrucomicrobia bacterium RIFCSPHIGHO2_12_FULL_41_10]HLB41193.1 glycosyltransferase family A protein [Candidatus Babeliales bacterium]